MEILKKVKILILLCLLLRSQLLKIIPIFFLSSGGKTVLNGQAASAILHQNDLAASMLYQGPTSSMYISQDQGIPLSTQSVTAMKPIAEIETLSSFQPSTPTQVLMSQSASTSQSSGASTLPHGITFGGYLPSQDPIIPPSSHLWFPDPVIKSALHHNSGFGRPV